MIAGRDRHGNPILGRIAGKSLCRQLMEKEAEKRRLEKAGKRERRAMARQKRREARQARRRMASAKEVGENLQ